MSSKGCLAPFAAVEPFLVFFFFSSITHESKKKKKKKKKIEAKTFFAETLPASPPALFPCCPLSARARVGIHFEFNSIPLHRRAALQRSKESSYLSGIGNHYPTYVSLGALKSPLVSTECLTMHSAF